MLKIGPCTCRFTYLIRAQCLEVVFASTITDTKLFCMLYIQEPVIELHVSEIDTFEDGSEPVSGDTRIVAFADSQAGGEDSDEERRKRKKKRRAVKSKKYALSWWFIMQEDIVLFFY